MKALYSKDLVKICIRCNVYCVYSAVIYWEIRIVLKKDHNTEIAFNKISEILLKTIKHDSLLKEYFPSVQDLLDKHLVKYGKSFVTRLEKYGTTEKEEPLILYDWVKEFAEAVGDLRIHRVLTAGNAQCGKSLINTLFLVDFLIFTGLNTLWFYPSKQQVDTLVPELFGKVVKYYLANIEAELHQLTGEVIELSAKDDRKLASRFQVRGATAIFSYASNSGKDNAPTKSGLATVGAAAASVSASLMFIDERSQIPPEAAAVLPRRLDAGRIPTQPIREVGTFGAGLGIESVVEQSKHHFYPHIKCDNCGKIIALSPKGCLLRHNESGNFLSETGRPINWFYHDVVNKIESAFFGCSNCGEEITKQQRLAAHFRDLNDVNITLRNYLNSLSTVPENAYQYRDTITIHLSPLLRNSAYNLAGRLIDTGLNSESVRDYQQQVLGFSSESDTSRVTKDMIEAAIRNERESRSPDYVIAGIDQGRSEDYLVICEYWLPTEENLSAIQKIENSKRNIIFCEPINRRQLENYCKRFQVNFGFIDNEPDRQGAFDIAQRLPIVPADQRKYLAKVITDIDVSTGGIEIKAKAIDNAYFQDMALNAFASGAVKVPDSWNTSDKGIYSPTRHFMNVSKDENNEWLRAKDHIDDLWYAFVFAEAAYYTVVKEKLDSEMDQGVAWYRCLK